ncbi:hypothetical protein [Leucobacter muris]|uniref:hypothetical protein n=1 Tax=Leucobacter muris TaxID=1935379 RepID=UPI002B1F4BF7|nr:hypothetical protein [Leucobacter muris]
MCALALAGALAMQGVDAPEGSGAAPGTGSSRQADEGASGDPAAGEAAVDPPAGDPGPSAADPGSAGAPVPAPAPAAERTAAETLDALPVKGRAPKTGYDRRTGFGSGWQDPDRNGCDARNDTLQRDLADARLDGPCTVLSGVLLDPYTGARIDFVRGERTSQAVQIDHVVALSDAWQKARRRSRESSGSCSPTIRSTCWRSTARRTRARATAMRRPGCRPSGASAANTSPGRSR